MTEISTQFEWEERLRRVPETGAAKAKRWLFEALNPHLDRAQHLRRVSSGPRPASVLIPILNRVSGPSVLFTVRTPTMPSHAGEISFPGGGPKNSDTGPVSTALRETAEEIGIDADRIEVLGSLGIHFGGIDYAVTPVVGWIANPDPMLPSPREVQEIFEVPLEILVARERHIIETRTLNNVPYRMHAFPYSDGNADRHIWGLTAGILNTFVLAFHDLSVPE